MKIVIAGVCGSGKTTVGTMLAERLGCEFADADDFHPPENLAKMKAGVPLDDADRAGWLGALGLFLASRERVVLACSALKRTYRERLRELGGPLRFFMLMAEPDELARRMGSRDHFMPVGLLDSQLAIQEQGDDVTLVDNRGPDARQALASVVRELGGSERD